MASRMIYTGDTVQLDLRRPRAEDKQHLDFIRMLPCLACGVMYDIEAAHLRHPNVRYLKTETGTGTKPSDVWAIPLCPCHHREGKYAQHNMKELDFYKRMKITDPWAICMTLAFHSPDTLMGAKVINAHRSFMTTDFKNQALKEYKAWKFNLTCA